MSASGATAYTYDAADALASIDPPGAGNTVAFTLDALGRNRTRLVNGSTVDTYGYAGESETVDLLARSTGTIQSAVSASGDRTAMKQGTPFGWTLPDLHGSMAAMLSSTGAAVSDAFRYDPYGEDAGTSVSGPSSPWRFNGSLLLTDPGSSDLYAMGARSYDPALAAFTQLDSVKGDAQNPFSLNRYLFAWANPVGMVDPSGHIAQMLVDGVVGSGAAAAAVRAAAQKANAAADAKARQRAAAQAGARLAARMAAIESRYERHQPSPPPVKVAKVAKFSLVRRLPTNKALWNERNEQSDAVKPRPDDVRGVVSHRVVNADYAERTPADPGGGPGIGAAAELGLDAFGFVPVIGDIVDAGRAVFDAATWVGGDPHGLERAALNSLAIVPVVGSFGKQALKHGDEAIAIGADILKNSEEAGRNLSIEAPD